MMNCMTSISIQWNVNIAKLNLQKKIVDVWITTTKQDCLEKLFVTGAMFVIVILNIQMDIRDKHTTKQTKKHSKKNERILPNKQAKNI